MVGFCVLQTRFSLILEIVVWVKEKCHWIYPTLVYLTLRRHLSQFQHHAQQFPFHILVKSSGDADSKHLYTTLRLKFRSMTYVFRRVRKTGKKTFIIFVMSCLCLSVCLSVGMEQVGSHRTDFHKIWYRIFRKSVEKIPVSLKYDKNNGYFKRRRHVYLWHHAEFFLEWRMLQTEVAERDQNTHFIFHNFPKIVPFMRCGKIL